MEGSGPQANADFTLGNPSGTTSSTGTVVAASIAYNPSERPVLSVAMSADQQMTAPPPVSVMAYPSCVAEPQTRFTMRKGVLRGRSYSAV